MPSSLASGPIVKPLHNNHDTTGFKPWLICLTAALFFFYEFIQMNMFNVISPELMSTFHVTAESLGQLSAYCFYATIIFLLPAGQLLDRYSTRKIILTAMSICVIGTTGFALTQSYQLAHVFRFMTGIGSAFCFLSAVRLASRWFSPRHLALVIGIIVMVAMLGGMVSQKPLSMLNEALGWRQTLLYVSACGAFITFLNWLVIQDYPSEQHRQAELEQRQQQEISYWQSMRLSYLRPQNWLGGIYTTLMNMPVVLLGSLWGDIYLQQAKHFTNGQAATITSMLFFGALIGSPIAGWVSDYLSLRRLPMIAGALLALGLAIIILYVPTLTYLDYEILFFAMGFITSCQVISYPCIAESNPSTLTATAVSVISVSTQIGFAIFQPLFGLLLDRQWDGSKVHGVPIYTTAAYHNALLMVLPTAFLIALLMALLMTETYCRRLPQSH